jgi:hypothetical protein
MRTLKIDQYPPIGNMEFETTIELGSAKNLRLFIKEGEEIFKMYHRSNGHEEIYQITKINKIKHTSIVAIVRKISLREYNLETLLK